MSARLKAIILATLGTVLAIVVVVGLIYLLITNPALAIYAVVSVLFCAGIAAVWLILYDKFRWG